VVFFLPQQRPTFALAAQSNFWWSGGEVSYQLKNGCFFAIAWQDGEFWQENTCI
jgi:hypothetical protein